MWLSCRCNAQFQNGFKRLALSEPAAFMGGCSPELTLMDWLKELERRLNVRVVEQVDHFGTSCSVVQALHARSKPSGHGTVVLS